MCIYTYILIFIYDYVYIGKYYLKKYNNPLVKP